MPICADLSALLVHDCARQRHRHKRATPSQLLETMSASTATRETRLRFPPSYAIVGVYRLCTDPHLYVPIWAKVRHGVRRGAVVGFGWVRTCLELLRAPRCPPADAESPDAAHLQRATRLCPPLPRKVRRRPSATPPPPLMRRPQLSARRRPLPRDRLRPQAPQVLLATHVVFFAASAFGFRLCVHQGGILGVTGPLQRRKGT